MIQHPQRHTDRRKRFVVAMAAVGAVAALAGCADFSGIEGHAKMREPSSLAARGAADKPSPTLPWLRSDVWREYGDAQLDALMEQALSDNPSLQQARLRLERAQAQSGVARAALLPQLGAGVEINRELYSAHSLYPAPLAGSVENSGTVQLSGSWELDFFGKNRAALDSAIGSVQAAAADAQAARLLLASNVVRSYYQLARAGAQLEVAERTLEQRKEMLGLVHSRLAAGLDTQLELRQSQGGIPEAQLQIEALREQQALAKNALATLVGDPSAAQRLKVPSLPAALGVSAPAEVPLNLLGQRADVVAARWRVEAASRDTDVARAQFYPNINLKAYAGFSALGFSNLFKSSSEQWGVGPAINLPLFSGGRLRANLRVKTADLDTAIESYNGTVLEAVHDAADQLVTAQSLERQQTEQRNAQQAAEGAYQIAVQRYKAGLSTYLQVLATESNVLQQRRAAVDLKARVIDTQVALWRALGGGLPTSPVAVTNDRGTLENGAIRVQSALAGQRPDTAAAPATP
jgi:NodT family efflux transporter outer membrane factor (OMF) lipoprotein